MSAPDPDAAAWSAYAAMLHKQATAELDEAFDWLERGVLVGDDDAGVSVVIALVDLEDGRALPSVVHDIMHAAERAKLVT